MMHKPESGTPGYLGGPCDDGFVSGLHLITQVHNTAQGRISLHSYH